MTTNTPTYEQLIAARLDPARIERPIPIGLEFFHCEFLYYPNRSSGFIKRIKAHPPIRIGWTTPKPITDPASEWSCWTERRPDGIPWYYGVYRLHHWWDNKPLPVETKSGKDGSHGIIYVGRHKTWLKVRVPQLRKTHLAGIDFGPNHHRPLSPENQIRYPKERLAISWLGCFSGPVTAAVEALLIRQYDPIHNRSQPMNDNELEWWINNTDIEADVAAEYLGDIKWMEIHLAWRRRTNWRD